MNLLYRKTVSAINDSYHDQQVLYQAEKLYAKHFCEPEQKYQEQVIETLLSTPFNQHRVEEFARRVVFNESNYLLNTVNKKEELANLYFESGYLQTQLVKDINNKRLPNHPFSYCYSSAVNWRVNTYAHLLTYGQTTPKRDEAYFDQRIEQFQQRLRPSLQQDVKQLNNNFSQAIYTAVNLAVVNLAISKLRVHLNKFPELTQQYFSNLAYNKQGITHLVNDKVPNCQTEQHLYSIKAISRAPLTYCANCFESQAELDELVRFQRFYYFASQPDLDRFQKWLKSYLKNKNWLVDRQGLQALIDQQAVQARALTVITDYLAQFPRSAQDKYYARWR